jgi:hypothetical protein
MADKRPKRIILRTPAGIAKYPKLFTPDTKFKKEGEYSVKLILQGEDAATLTGSIDRGLADSLTEAKLDAKNKGKKIKPADAPYKAVVDDEGNETGETQFTFKMNAAGTRKDGTAWTRRPMVFDAKGAVVKDAKVGGGSKIKVAYEMSKFYTPLVGAGVSLRLEAVQIITLVEYGNRDAKGYGFEAEEGYEASEQTAEETPAEEAEATPADATNEKDF